MERLVKNCKIVFANVAFPIRPILREHWANFSEILRVHGPAVEIAFSKLDAHGFTTSGIKTKFCSAPIQHGIHLPDVWLVIDHTAIDLDPSVGLERHVLCADHHLSRDSVAFQQTRSRG